VTVTDRIQMLRSGDVGVSDYTIDGAVELLQGLHDRGIELTLASGTDQEDVQREAETLGYAHLFAGGIHGSAGNEVGDAKRAVIQRLLGDPDCSGADLMVIGDGPTEIREGRRAGALCMGVASDEINRRGLNARKRMRLIRAGTDIIVPDFSQLDSILRVLGL
jgi:phosphoglycolate phosphatase-like HAD superfamily hydrolase